jgi:hypothetical protein
MLGWDIIISRQLDGGTVPATVQSPRGTRIAWWCADVYGIDWLDDLVRAGKAMSFGDSPGYPYRYTARAKDVLPFIDQPPDLKSNPTTWPKAEAVVDAEAVAVCRPDEWLHVEAWDQS